MFFWKNVKRNWTWKLIKIAINCLSISNEGNAEWNETLATGEIVIGKCLNGYNGTISRSCIRNDLIGNWSSISGFCEGISLF